MSTKSKPTTTLPKSKTNNHVDTSRKPQAIKQSANKKPKPTNKKVQTQQPTTTTTTAATTVVSTPIQVESTNEKNKQDDTSIGPVLLGYSDGYIEEEDLATLDVYQSRIGGLPIWFDETQLPGIDVTRCSACQHQMRLLVQVYAPLDHQPHDRVLYIWGCNRRRCMRTQGCFRVIRAVQMNEAYARKLKKKNKPKKPPTTNVVSQPVKPSTSIGMGIGVSTSSNGTKSFSFDSIWTTGQSTMSTGPFSNSISGGLFGTPAANTVKSTQDDMTETQKEPKQSGEPIVFDKLVSSAWPQNQPEFAGQWLYVEEEKLESDDPFRNLDKKYIKYIKDFERSEALDGGDMSAADGVGQGGDEMGWEGEQYEKSWRPKGVDKAFKRFTEIVQENPDQCIRYQYGGKPLLYTHQDTVAAQVLGTNTSIPVCPRCGAKRTFEMQLMPGLMQMLETSRYAEQQDDTSGGSTNGVSGLDSFDLGMEWGTILIYTCSRDCFDRGFDAPNAVITHGAVRYHEELALVQHEV